MGSITRSESAAGIASSRRSPTSKARRQLASSPARLSSSIRFSTASKIATSNHGTALLYLSLGPIAAQQSGVRLTNPSGSNVIAVVEKALLSVQTTEVVNLEYGRVGGTLSQVAVSIPMETRGRSAATCVPSFNAAALSTLNVIASITLLATTPLDFINDGIQEISLPPGASLQIDGTQ